MFYISLLNQNTTKKGQVDENVKKMDFDAGNENENYKLKAISNNAVYAQESESGHLLELYYLIF